MIEQTIAQIERRLADSSLPENTRRELLLLLEQLKQEVDDLARSDAEQALSIARFAQISAHEATREQRNEDLAQLSLNGLSSSVRNFETSHPQLVQVVNRFCNLLSNSGI